MNTEQLNALKDRAYKIAVEHGFHDDVKSDAYYLDLVMSEAGEAINADRKGWHGDAVLFDDDEKEGVSFAENFKKHIKDSVEDEIADIVIRLLDFAGMNGYELDIVSVDHVFSNHALMAFWDYKLPGLLFSLIGLLSDAVDEGETFAYVGTVICVLSDCFDKITGGNDCDLWWFVEQKMKYNELRPKLNCKKY